MKPQVHVKCVANTYAQKDERIVEFSFPDTNGPLGGLIRFGTLKGKPSVQLYRVDRKVRVTVSKEP